MVLVASIATASFVACQGEERAPRPTTDSAGTTPTDSSPVITDGDSSPVVTDGGADSVVDTTISDVATDDGAVDAADAPSDADSPSDALDADARVCLPALSTSAAGACSSIVQSWPNEGATHWPAGTALSYCTRPPSSGDHYDIWAAYRTYDKPVPYGYLVHSLEHGAVVLLYKCASGSCPTIQSQLQAIADARPVDPSCTSPVQRRIIIAPDPTLDVDIGAAAWGFTYRASCVDATSLGKFIDDHYAKATEDICADGIVPP